VAVTANGERHEVIFDPTTTQLLAEQSVDAATGHVDSWTSYLESTLVAAVKHLRPGTGPDRSQQTVPTRGAATRTECREAPF